MKAGLIGEKLGHSFSKEIHESVAGYNYDLIELNAEAFDSFMKEKKFDAINVTIPYKEKVIAYCDEIDEKAKRIGAVNAIKNKNGKLLATNTDYEGMKWSLTHHFSLQNKMVAIMGSGGTSKTAFTVCEDLGCKEIVRVARNRSFPYISYEELNQRKDIQILINTTSVGMSPNIMEALVDLTSFKKLEGVMDVVYNPLTTSLCHQAKELKIPCVNGLEMLVGQALFAIDFFTETQTSKQEILTLTKNIRNEKQNLVLIGMPGCGKSSIGKKLSRSLHKEFIDIDKEIEKDANMKISDIFEKETEAGFRKREHEKILEISKKNGYVISCGGGVIKNEDNMKALSLNGWIVFLDRDVTLLETGKGRPLSQDLESVKRLEKERRCLYEKYSDITIKNNGAFMNTIHKVMEAWNENTGD